MSEMPAGHYHAEGDPPGTVRYWDGSQWVGDPIPAPPTTPPPPPGAAAGGAPERFATLGIRLGAGVIDMVIVVIISFVLLAAFFGESDGDGSFNATSDTGGTILISLGITAAYVAIIGLAGGTPGKLITGLLVTEADGRTQVGWRGAVMRSLPYILGFIPLLGLVIVVGCIIAAMVMIGGSDPERQSVYDRIGSTRVVYKNRL